MEVRSPLALVTTDRAVAALADLRVQIEDSTTRLTSGKRLLGGGQDTAAISLAVRLQSQLTSLREDFLNNAQGRGLLQVANGGLAQIGDLLNQQRTLAGTANAASLTDNERSFLDVSFQNLATEIDRIASTTRFDGLALLDGTGNFTFQYSGDASNQVTVVIDAVDTATLYGGATPTLATQPDAQATLTTLDAAEVRLQSGLANISSSQSRLDAVEANLSTSIQGVDEARRAITDTDIASESARYAFLTVQQQVGTSVLAQTQQLNSSLLNLLAFKLPLGLAG